MFFEDYDIASLSWTRGIKKNDDGYANSLFLSNFYDLFVATQQNRVIERFLETFPEGLPSIQTDNYYILDDAIEWTRSQITQLPQPFLGYFHLLPPHGPYKTKKIYNSRFAEDGMEFIEKQEHMFTAGWGDKVLYNERVAYDEYILYVDEQFGRLYGSLSSEFLQNTWIILTSDHGEMFERGIKAHQQPVFYEPVIRIPLMILEPGRTSRSDVYSLTSAVDLLPTLLSFNGLGGPDFLEGKILPPYADNGK
jgi:arylsulfatase A-like enzyme